MNKRIFLERRRVLSEFLEKNGSSIDEVVRYTNLHPCNQSFTGMTPMRLITEYYRSDMFSLLFYWRMTGNEDKWSKISLSWSRSFNFL